MSNDYLQLAIAAAQRGDDATASEAARAVLHSEPHLLLGGAVKTALFNRVSLNPPLLGELTDELQRVEIGYEWMGWGDNYRAAISLYRSADGGSFSGRAQAGNQTLDLDCPAAMVLALPRALDNLVPTPQPVNLLVISDSYPRWRVELLYPDDMIVEVSSESNTSTFIPWNIGYQGQLWVQYSVAFPTALFTLLAGRVPFMPEGAADMSKDDLYLRWSWGLQIPLAQLRHELMRGEVEVQGGEADFAVGNRPHIGAVVRF